MALIRSGDRVVLPLGQRTCSTIGSPGFGGFGHSARKRKGFHSPYESRSIITAHTCSSGAAISTVAPGRASGIRSSSWVADILVLSGTNGTDALVLRRSTPEGGVP